MAETYTLHVAGLTRELTICKVNDHMDIAAFIQLHQAGERQAQHALVQAADAVGQLLGQHGHHLVGIVHAGGTVKGFVVQLTAGLDVVRHIRNMHAQLKAAQTMGNILSRAV